MMLEKAALAVRENAYAPYSNFKVGAAIRSKNGAVYVGCNVENIAYPEGTCAEAGAIAAMVAAGETEFKEVFVVADSPSPVTPCGGCRQKLAEFGSAEGLITLANLDGLQTKMTMAELLPGAFSQDHMRMDREDQN
ncbi:cytidine deaminase [Pseudopelagicola sp. nBUS_19]|uniref:cytidine deaminase n=1 Tax=unclassified Pseudopelagicola TaxID=2649563 RepID=UPI003EBC702E